MASNKYILNLYKQLMREGQKFPDYNFRSYAVRRVKDAFREGQKETDQLKAKVLLQKAEENLAMMKRQAILGNLYRDNISIIESIPK